jgi:UDP-glucose 4-epimerase
MISLDHLPLEYDGTMIDQRRSTVLVVGGAGYIGSHAARELRRKGYEAIIYDNLSTGHQALAKGFELIVGDLSDTSKLRLALQRVDAVMHFAACAYVSESVTNPRKYFQNNVVDGISLLNEVIDSGVRKFVFSSTCATYGIPQVMPITEKTPLLPINPYGLTKRAFENALEAYSHAYGLRFVSFRYFNAAGADESGEIGEVHVPETHLIPSAFEAIHGERPELEIFGADYPTPDGTCIRDYIHVNDLAEAHVAGIQYLEKGPSTSLNLGTGQGNSVREVIGTIERVTGKPVPQRVAPRREGDPPQLVADPSLAQKVLGWKARRSLQDIVATAWKWDQSRRSTVASAG